MQPLSPKKYIETKARSLPLYRCFVNKDWKESMFADVVVMRRHTNGHITAGIYQVDLLCQGVKETAFIFNEAEEEVHERIPALKGDAFVEIDYNLAHNIIFAGHDFALDFDIHPEKDFALTRFILEEDTDDIPLIEVPVGDEEGKPVLIASPGNSQLDILAKLKKYAGEGNYTYIQEDELKEEEELALDDLPLGEVNLSTVQKLRQEDMEDDVKVAGRLLEEQILIETELLYIELPPELTDFSAEEEARLERIWEELTGSTERHNGVTSEQLREYREVLDQMIAFTTGTKDDAFEENYESLVDRVLQEHGDNPVVVSAIYETGIALNKARSAEAAKEKALADYTRYPLLELSLALGSLLEKHRDPRFERVYQAAFLAEAFPAAEEFSGTEVVEFWLIRLMVHLEAGQLKEALLYLTAIRASEADPWLLVSVFAELNIKLEEYLESHNTDKENGQEEKEQ